MVVDGGADGADGARVFAEESVGELGRGGLGVGGFFEADALGEEGHFGGRFGGEGILAIENAAFDIGEAGALGVLANVGEKIGVGIGDGLDEQRFEVLFAGLRFEEGHAESEGFGVAARRRQGRFQGLAPGGAGGDFDQTLAGIGLVAFFGGAGDIFAGGGGEIALIFADGGQFKRKQAGAVQFAAAFVDAGDGFVVLVVIPVERGGFEVVGGAAGGEGDDLVPVGAGAVVALLFGLHFAEAGEDGGVGGVGLGEGFFELDGGIELVQRAMDGGGAGDERGVGREVGGYLLEQWRGGFEVALPEFAFGEEKGGGLIGIRLGLEGCEFGVQLVGAGEVFEEACAEGFVEDPVGAEEALPFDGVGCGAVGVGGEEVFDERNVMGETAVGVEVDLAVEDRVERALLGGGGEVLFEFGAGEGGCSVAGVGVKLGCHLLAEEEAGELVGPRFIRELLDGAAVGGFHFAGDFVLFEEGGEAFVEAGIIGVAIDLAAVESHGEGGLADGDEAGDVAIEHARVFRVARGAGVFADGDAAGLGAEFVEERVVEGEFGLRLVEAGVGVGGEEGDAGTLGGVGEGGEESGAEAGDAVRFGVERRRLDDLRVEGRAARGLGEAGVEHAEQFGGGGAVEIGDGFAFLIAQLVRRVLAIENERDDAVPEAGIGVEGGDVAVEREIAATEAEGLGGLLDE